MGKYHEFFTDEKEHLQVAPKLGVQPAESGPLLNFENSQASYSL